MKQIGNWVFGSFFRTIGRLLVFILLGIIIANIIDFGSIKDNFSITDLFFIKIKADTQTSGMWQTYYTTQQKTTEYAYTNNYAKGTITYNGNNVTIIDYWLGTNITKKANEDYLYIPIMILGENYNMTQAQEISVYYCDDWREDYVSSIHGYSCMDTSGMVSDIHMYVPTQLTFNVKLRAPNQTDAFCTPEGNMWKCMLKENTTYQAIRIEYNYSLSNYNQLYIGVNRGISFYKDGVTSVTDSINNQTQQQQQQHNETQSYLEDSNTTQAENEATSFFEDFDAPDVGGLSAIITAPLNTIRSLLNSSCTNLVLPLPYLNNQNLTLPCMYSIYTEHFGAFFTIYQTIILAIVAYRCIRSIYFDLHGFTNPNDDRIEVMDL